MRQVPFHRDAEPNPYESPSSTLLGDAATTEKAAARGLGLVTTSFVLAVLIEVFPTETDMTAVAFFAQRNVPAFLTEKAIFLSIILAPLLLYFWINGWRGVMAAKRRIVAIGIIVVLKLALDAFWLVSYFPHTK